MLDTGLDTVFQPPALASLLSMASRKLTVEKLLRDSGLIHADDMPGPFEPTFCDHYLDADDLSSLEVFEIWTGGCA